MPNMSHHETNAELDLLLHPRDPGHEAANDWTATNFGARGKRPTFDPEFRFTKALRKPQCTPAAHAEGAA
jgi:hypothetical protein